MSVHLGRNAICNSSWQIKPNHLGSKYHLLSRIIKQKIHSPNPMKEKMLLLAMLNESATRFDEFFLGPCHTPPMSLLKIWVVFAISCSQKHTHTQTTGVNTHWAVLCWQGNHGNSQSLKSIIIRNFEPAVRTFIAAYLMQQQYPRSLVFRS